MWPVFCRYSRGICAVQSLEAKGGIMLENKPKRKRVKLKVGKIIMPEENDPDKIEKLVETMKMVILHSDQVDTLNEKS